MKPLSFTKLHSMNANRFLFLLILCTAICLISSLSYGQILPKRVNKDTISVTALKSLIDSGIDPRKYVTVFYKKRADVTSHHTLGIWRWDNMSQHQRFKVLDKDGVLNIYFDKNELAKDTKFKGNISLSAKVKSKAGERAIEVAPYSRVGEARKTFGTESISPELTAQLLFNAIFTMKSTVLSGNITIDTAYNYRFKNDSVEVKLMIAEIKEKNLSAIPVDITSAENIPTLSMILENYGLFLEAIRIKKNLANTSYKYGTLAQDLKRLVVAINAKADYDKEQALEKNWPTISSLTKNLNTIVAYIDAFDGAGPDAKNVFIRLMGKDIITYEQLKGNLKLLQSKLKFMKENWNASYPQIVDGTYNSLLKDIKLTLTEISSIAGSDLDRALAKDYSSIKSSNSLDAETEFLRMQSLKENPTKFKQVIDQLSITAGTYLYSLLTYATIDLAKNDVKEGDILYLYVRWKNYKDHMVDSLKNKEDEEMEIGTYRIQKTGWSTEVSDSFYLIERINEPGKNVDENVSPSNFKGAAGISLMRTFNYSEPNGSNNYQFLNWLQPSVGLNLSYIDFYTNKDIELGLGAQLGLFKNSIFVGYGVNLNGIRGGDKSATYFMLGLSFTNLAAKFKSE